MTRTISQDDTRQKLAALTKLGVLRREKLDAADFKAYLEELAPVPAVVVENVCRQLSREEPGDFEPRYPPLHLVLTRCRAEQQRAAERKALSAPPAVPDPITPAQWTAIQAQFKAVLRGKAWR
jgi:hypothetical protein